jgi:hypothetical protein
MRRRIGGRTVEFNLAELSETIAAAIPDRPMLRWRGRTQTYR